MDLGLAGAAVCVQGGSKGVGRAAAECFAADSARVAIMGRRPERLELYVLIVDLDVVYLVTYVGTESAWPARRM
jgi:NAD(P)-dependent dehydrogenase (short-subunit alcohol dehydrogenase family)